MSESPDPLAPIRLAVAEVVSTGRPTLDSVAAEIHTSPRSLQRHVKRHGATMRTLIDEARMERAQTLLRSSTESFSSIARQLGYSDERSFRRAFRRWTGSSPSDYRADGAPGR